MPDGESASIHVLNRDLVVLCLLAQFSNSATQVKQWLSKVVELAKPKLALLDVKILLKVVGRVEHYNNNIRASDAYIRHITATENREGQKGPISYFSAGIKGFLCSRPAHDPGRGAGIAWVGAACHTRSGMQININEHVPWRVTFPLNQSSSISF